VKNEAVNVDDLDPDDAKAHPPLGGSKDPLKHGAPSEDGQPGIKKPRSTMEKAVSKYQEGTVEIQKEHLSLENEKLKVLRLHERRREEQRELKEARLARKEDR
jgi:hypothetical protein